MNLVIWLIVLAGLLVLFVYILIAALLSVVKRLVDTNKQLFLLLAGRGEKSEPTLRALVASNKPPQGKLKGIATGGKKDDKPKNIDCTMEIGHPR